MMLQMRVKNIVTFVFDQSKHLSYLFQTYNLSVFYLYFDDRLTWGLDIRENVYNNLHIEFENPIMFPQFLKQFEFQIVKQHKDLLQTSKNKRYGMNHGDTILTVS